jgi:hypothetical protein
VNSAGPAARIRFSAEFYRFPETIVSSDAPVFSDRNR